MIQQCKWQLQQTLQWFWNPVNLKWEDVWPNLTHNPSFQMGVSSVLVWKPLQYSSGCLWTSGCQFLRECYWFVLDVRVLMISSILWPKLGEYIVVRNAFVKIIVHINMNLNRNGGNIPLRSKRGDRRTNKGSMRFVKYFSLRWYSHNTLGTQVSENSPRSLLWFTDISIMRSESPSADLHYPPAGRGSCWVRRRWGRHGAVWRRG